mmetsp:Transcript_99685/g.282322  ORF Transcript_99685/g.282322 Transcript_99685/m.282322 type:complete len:351 (+) Transcript_99685:270-1322(+)
MFEAHLPPVLLVLVPACLALVEVLVEGVHGPDALVEVVVRAGAEGAQLGAHALDHDGHGHRVLRVVLVRGPVAVRVRLVARELVGEAVRQHALDVARVVQEELVPRAARVAADARGEGREVRRVHAQGVREDYAPVVPVGPGAHHLLDAVQPVAGVVADEAQGLDDVRDARQLLAALQVQRVPRAALQQVHDVLAAAPGHGQEGHVPDAEAAGARDRALRPVLGRVHGVVLPGVPKAALQEHRLKCPQQHGCGHGHDGLVDEPAAHARARQVLASRHQEHLLAPVLHARPDVFNCERAIAKDRTPAAFEVIEGNVVVHAIAYVPVKRALTWVINDPWLEVGARKVKHCAR